MIKNFLKILWFAVVPVGAIWRFAFLMSEIAVETNNDWPSFVMFLLMLFGIYAFTTMIGHVIALFLSYDKLKDMNALSLINLSITTNYISFILVMGIVRDFKTLEVIGTYFLKIIEFLV